MPNRATARLTAGELIAEGSDFARDAWRDAWLIMLLLVTAHTVLFLNHHVPLTEWSPGPLGWIAPLLLVLYVPLYGALYRLAVGGPALRTLGPGGLQWSAVEWRMIAVGVVVAVLAGLAAIPFLLVTLIVMVALGIHAVLSAGPAGQWARWAPAAGVLWLIYGLVMGPRIARLALGWPFSVARDKLSPFAGWSLTRRSGWSLVIALIVAALPLAFGWAVLYAFSLLDPVSYGGNAWPLLEGVGAGALLGVLKVAVAAPLAVGVLSGAYWLTEGDLVAEPAHDAPAHDDLPTDASLAAAAALAAQEAAELGLHPAEVDPAAADYAELDSSLEAHDAPANDHAAEPELKAAADDGAASAEAHTALHEGEDEAKPEPAIDITAEHTPEPVEVKAPTVDAHPAFEPEAEAEAGEAEVDAPHSHAAEAVVAALTVPAAAAVLARRADEAPQVAEVEHAEHDHAESAPAVAPPAAPMPAEIHASVADAEPMADHGPALSVQPPAELAPPQILAPTLQPVTHAPLGGPVPLSAWPHSVLPPWPSLAPVSYTPPTPRPPNPPLASPAEPAQPLGGESEPH